MALISYIPLAFTMVADDYTTLGATEAAKGKYD